MTKGCHGPKNLLSDSDFKLAELCQYSEYALSYWFNQNVVVNGLCARTCNNQYMEQGRHLGMRIM